ncbi:hypothetical protein RV11_GL001011 [Enterococcus phoeniculicola]|uniref:Uncharacterized protein n=1 Tax=Enterococcus phoeniculicola ATCC BAA-412 TaxID=1158610 RepID=R3W180_9ENTE|nr:Tm-1-like ATP-binding domain-containing protein [Enterococcus phoeniculicola]EOL41231.1 hypothetical protein UC3_03440 [Enterococcus phoeniculicola ATCC BAA-412]EOT78631.1 hypothetical protein I589_00136 [Enterococcus phoeniculicola ATCC BAA-412]OJG70611.1 hypothetical protein RV11_GL001011 [Enterococcus phoeniculicola]
METKTVALVGTFDTKGEEYLYIRNLFHEVGIQTLTIHTGVFAPQFKPDVSNEEVVKEANVTIEELVEKKDRAYATEVLAKGMEKLIPKLYKDGKFDGIISFGGSGGTSLAAKAMQALPIGVPKLMVSTMAGGDISPYVGTSDIMMMPSIVDVAGLNSISMQIFKNAVFAMSGMLHFEVEERKHEKKPLIAATMFGVTTPAVNFAREYLEERGYEVLVFHATGSGGKTMEALVSSGYIDGVLDLTTTEWADELVGGVLKAGEHRLEAAGLAGIPQVVSVGALDMVNFGPIDTVPEKFKDRLLYKHNPTVTLMRTTKKENQLLGNKLAEKLNMAKGKTTLLLPLKGISGIDVDGEIFYGPEEDEQLFITLKKQVTNDKVTIIEREEAINEKAFAEFAAQELIDLLKK